MAHQTSPAKTTIDIHHQLAGQSAQVLAMLGIDSDALSRHIRCPLGTHADRNPSFKVVPKMDRYFCSCTSHGASMVDLVINMGAAKNFREAVALLRSQLRLAGGNTGTGTGNATALRSAPTIRAPLQNPLAAVRAVGIKSGAISGTNSATNAASNATTNTAGVSSSGGGPYFDQILASCTQPGRHPYLARKRVAPIQALFDSGTNRLVLRIHDASGQTVGLQLISEDGSKRCANGTVLSGNGLVLGNIVESNVLGVAEGWATGVSIYSQCNIPILVTFGAGNLAKALQNFLRAGQQALIFADNDEPGRVAAAQARALLGPGRCSILIPKDEGSDFNDLWVRSSQQITSLSHSGNFL